MAFPSPSLTPPALGPYEISYQGLTFGGIAKGGFYFLQSLNIDRGDIAAGDVQRALDQGEFAGTDVLGGADITITQIVSGGYQPTGQPPSSAQIVAVEQAVANLGAVMGPAGITEAPLWLQLPSGCFAFMCRPRKHNCPFDITRVFAGGVIATSLLHCTDPRRYAAPSKTQTIGLPAPPLGGATFPATFDLSFGGGGIGGLVSVYNNGLFECRPILIVSGPCINPVITNLSIAGSPAIGVNITLNAGDTLQIDTDLQSVIYTTAGSAAGASRQSSLMAGSTWWTLLPVSGPAGIAGPNLLEFNTSDVSQVAGTLEVQSADAYLSL